MPSESTRPPQDLESLLAHLRASFPTLSTQFQSGARYLLDHPQDVAVLSMRKIAVSASVQPATLVRLSQHLGFEGWQGLRELFVDALRGGSQPYARRARKVMRESGSSRMLAEMLDAQHHNLDMIASSNDKTLTQAARSRFAWVTRARRPTWSASWRRRGCARSRRCDAGSAP